MARSFQGLRDKMSARARARAGWWAAKDLREMDSRPAARMKKLPTRMKELVVRANRKYNSIPEPTRFLLFLCVLIPFAFGASSESRVTQLLSLGWVLILIAIRLPFVLGWLDQSRDE